MTRPEHSSLEALWKDTETVIYYSPLDITEIRPHLSEVIGRGGDPKFPLHIDKLSTSSHPHMYKQAIYTKLPAHRKRHRHG